jgi:hypothetical protein
LRPELAADRPILWPFSLEEAPLPPEKVWPGGDSQDGGFDAGYRAQTRVVVPPDDAMVK